ncbi:MAG: hypothetical protein NTV48_02015 [Candidatus Vogelbacteria bacterium]|nr:hypothetical protein [Candidatus Vogelbacteria bacterium]
MFNPNNIHFGEFDESLFSSLEDASEIAEPTIKTQSNYHTVFVDDEKAGIVGILKPNEGGVDFGLMKKLVSKSYQRKN